MFTSSVARTTACHAQTQFPSPEKIAQETPNITISYNILS